MRLINLPQAYLQALFCTLESSCYHQPLEACHSTSSCIADLCLPSCALDQPGIKHAKGYNQFPIQINGAKSIYWFRTQICSSLYETCISVLVGNPVI